MTRMGLSNKESQEASLNGDLEVKHELVKIDMEVDHTDLDAIVIFQMQDS